MNCMFNGNFKVEWAVLPPGSNVAAIPDNTRAKVVILGSNCCQNQSN